MIELKNLAEISKFYGNRKEYVIAGGGNTSFKNKEKIWIKASGSALADLSEEEFAELDRQKLEKLSTFIYSEDADERERQVKQDLELALLSPGKRPSVETPLHNIINFSYVVHLHPTLVNGLMCAKDAEQELDRLFPAHEEWVYVPYTDPGYILFKKVSESLREHREKFKSEPHTIWLQNHGIFVCGESVGEIKVIYEKVLSTLEASLREPLPVETEMLAADASVVPALRMLLSSDELKVVKVRNNELISRYCASTTLFAKVSVPFIPDAIVYCKANYLYFPQDESAEILEVAKQEIDQFVEQYGYAPKVLALKNIGILAVGDDARQCDLILDVFEDAIKIAQLSESFGGPHPLNEEQIRFIDNWEVENYRRTVAARVTNGRLRNRVIIVTGAAQGFGEGIAKYLISEGANIVVADLNEATGARTAGLLDQSHPSARSMFVKTDVSDPASLEMLMQRTILEFGGVDCFISNAGVLRAGGLEEMTPETFDFVTRINYNAFFYCTRAVSRIMKLQTKFANPGYFADIIQINSKSGLRGSKANFAYAGGKFGGIGLTQSFALELAPHRIKVNAVCPGNYYEGPLWSDPENGLFVQYLNAGKVPGAKTVEDVKNFYLAQVPMRKGCTPEDVGKGVIYLMDQTGETGQALPVTGGQVMLA